MNLTSEHIAIMKHTATRAAGGMYYGDSPEMRELEKAGLMVFMGKPAFSHDPVFSLTTAGKDIVAQYARAEADARAAANGGPA